MAVIMLDGMQRSDSITLERTSRFKVNPRGDLCLTEFCVSDATLSITSCNTLHLYKRIYNGAKEKERRREGCG